MMDYSQVKEIVSVDDCEIANKYLSAGWILLNIHNTAHSIDCQKVVEQIEHFTMGRTSDEVQRPDLTYHYASGDMSQSL